MLLIVCTVIALLIQRGFWRGAISRPARAVRRR
jgi:hypothetical protein